MAEETRLDMFQFQGGFEEHVVPEEDHSGGDVTRGSLEATKRLTHIFWQGLYRGLSR